MANGMCSAIKPMGCTHKARDSTRGEKAGQVHSSEGRGVDRARHEREGRCAGSPAEAALRANYQVGLVPRSFLGDEQRAKTLASCVPQVRRLVVRMDAYLLYRHPQRHIYRLDEWLQVARASSGCLFSSWYVSPLL